MSGTRSDETAAHLGHLVCPAQPYCKTGHSEWIRIGNCESSSQSEGNSQTLCERRALARVQSYSE